MLKQTSPESAADYLPVTLQPRETFRRSFSTPGDPGKTSKKIRRRVWRRLQEGKLHRKWGIQRNVAAWVPQLSSHIVSVHSAACKQAVW